MDCFKRKSSDRGSLFCKLSCKNNLKRNAVAIKPINKMKSYAVCRCVTSPKNLADKDGTCHWRIANRIIDNPEFDNSYMENFYCSSRKAPSESETGITHPIYRIPPNMVCKQQLSGIWQKLNSLKPLLQLTTIWAPESHVRANSNTPSI